MSLWTRHQVFEKNSIFLLIGILVGDCDWWPRRDRSPVLSAKHDRKGWRGASLHAARIGGPQHLRPRRLLQLPFTDDPAVARRGRALRALFARRGEHV